MAARPVKPAASRTDKDRVGGDLTAGQRRALLAGGALLALGFAAYLAAAIAGVGSEPLFETWIYDAVFLGSAAACGARAWLVGRERAGWALMALALAAYAAAEIYYSAAITGSGEVPIPSPADGGYLSFYLLAGAGLIALTHRRLGRFSALHLLDGLIAGAAVAALAGALALGPILTASEEGATLATAVNVAYPIADLALLFLVVGVAAQSNWRPGGSWLVLGAGLVVLAATDVVYLFQSAEGTYAEGGLLDAAWLLGLLAIAAAAWISPGERRPAPRGARTAVVPAAAALTAIAILFAERFGEVPIGAAALALITLLGVVARLLVGLQESRESLAATEREALSDPLTGLGNRRALMEALEAAAASAARGRRLWLLAMFDLDGFKAYNDAYGHPAGDALLARLGRRLAAAAPESGAAYRLGGDEFCLLCECTASEVDALIAGAGAALSERGEGFAIGASQGSVLLPSEADSGEAALGLADRRMYANKSRERASAGSQSRDVLLSALRERQPELHRHLLDVAAMARRVAVEMGLEAEQRDEVFRAAELHDVGKVAIPDAILAKPGPLEPAEWEFMRKHTLIGERIIAAAPALVPVARLVRSTHERWDGDGYPDRLAGEEIPLGSRIIAVCDAYAAMIAERPYSVAMVPGRALEELRRGAGSQFDPAVVEVVCRLRETGAGFGGSRGEPHGVAD